MTEQTPVNLVLQQILSQDRTLYRAREDSKKRLFELISQVATKASVHLDAKDILEGLIAREKLGSTAIGHGVALPHARVNNIQQPIGIFIHLQEPIEFDAPDKQRVDLFFGILVPEKSTDAHLHLLATLAKLFHDENNRRQLRQAGSTQQLFQQIIDLSEQCHEQNQ